jgi:hypothetical protein
MIKETFSGDITQVYSHTQTDFIEGNIIKKYKGNFVTTINAVTGQVRD